MDCHTLQCYTYKHNLANQWCTCLNEVTNYTTEFKTLSYTSRIPLLYFTDNVLKTTSVIHNCLFL